MLLAANELVEQQPHADRDTIREWISGTAAAPATSPSSTRLPMLQARQGAVNAPDRQCNHRAAASQRGETRCAPFPIPAADPAALLAAPA
jgi:hypothetical protein